MLPDPIERIVRAHRKAVADHRLEPSSDVVEAVATSAEDRDPLGLTRGSCYAQLLLPFRTRFGGRLLVLTDHEFRHDPTRAVTTLAEHVGATAPDAAALPDVPVLSVPDDVRANLWPKLAHDVATFTEAGIDIGPWAPSGVALS
jgi:hypothetical protein